LGALLDDFSPWFRGPSILNASDTMKMYGYGSMMALLLLAGIALDARGQGLLIDEVFDYPVGTLESSSNWENFDAPGSLIDVVEGSLAYAGYGTMQGNRVVLDGSEGFNLPGQRFGAQTSGTIYGAALVHIDQGVPGLLSNRFLSFNVTPRLVNLTVLGDGARGDAFRLCASKNNLSTGCTGILAPGTYLLAFSYTFNPGNEDDVARLWVNPDLDQPEPASDAQDDGGGDAASISEAVLEQDSDLPVVEVDELRVATSWSALNTGGNTAPGQPTITAPQNGVTYTLTGDPARLFVAAWSSVTDPDSDPVAYTWQLSADAFASFLIDVDTGSATRYETTYGDLNALLDGAGVNPNETATFSHRVLASDGQTTSASTTQTVSFTRGTSTATEQKAIPDAFALSPIYPNPFNPEARFTLRVGQGQTVRVAVYDALGREVAVLHEGVLASGQDHLFTITAAGWPTGMYVLKATGTTFSAVRKALLMK